MSDELLHLTGHETVRIVSETTEELVVEVTWQPGSPPPPLHQHPTQEELFEVETGHLTAVVGGVTHQLEPGATLTIPRGSPHKLWNAGIHEASALWRTLPAGRTADWFRTVDRLNDGGARKPALPAMAAALTEYDDVFRIVVGPPALSPAVQFALRALSIANR